MSKTVAELLVGVLEQVGVTKRTGSEDRTATETTMPALEGFGLCFFLEEARVGQMLVHAIDHQCGELVDVVGLAVPAGLVIVRVTTANALDPATVGSGDNHSAMALGTAQ
jgi:hypothetical protein